MEPSKYLIKICKVWDKIVSDYTNVHLFNDQDYEFLSRLNSVEVESVINEMEKICCCHGVVFGCSTDFVIHPWCILNSHHDDPCENCEYAEQHGICGNVKSTYAKIYKELEIYGFTETCDIPDLLTEIGRIIHRYIKKYRN